MQRMSHSLTSTSFTLALLIGAYVIGMGILARLGALRNKDDNALLQLLAIVTGIGCIIVSLFILAAFHSLQPLPIVIVLLIEAALGTIWLKHFGDGLKAGIQTAWQSGKRSVLAHPYAGAAIGVVGVMIFFLAMRAPLEWDELAYHLPLARDFSSAGGLVVSDYLRYPLHASNYQLLYAGALIFSSESATHLIHALSGVLVTVGIFLFARREYNTATAALASLIFLLLSRKLLDTAYVDLGLSMFLFFSFVSLVLWQSRQNDTFLYISAFLLAMAAGTKYQGLLQLPLFALALLLAARGSVAPVFKAGLVLLAFGTYWYVRNWWLSGDPLNPLGGSFFGYTFWDPVDMAIQRADFERYRHHVPLMLIPALALVFLPGRRKPVEILLLVLGLGGLLAWYLTTRYDRYLLPTAPFLAILSGHVLVTLTARWSPAVFERMKISGRHRPVPEVAMLALLTVFAGNSVKKNWDETCFTHACVDRVYQARLLSAPVANAMNNFSELKLYQFGLENELYVLGADVVGDWFGPYRYNDVWELRNDIPALRDHLLQLDRDSILVNRGREYFADFPAGKELQPEFELLYEDKQVALYRITGN